MLLSIQQDLQRQWDASYLRAYAAFVNGGMQSSAAEAGGQAYVARAGQTACGWADRCVATVARVGRALYLPAGVPVTHAPKAMHRAASTIACAPHRRHHGDRPTARSLWSGWGG